jgi:hypothetical protein
MPKTAGNWPQLAFVFLAAMLALAAPGKPAEAAVNARLGPDEASDTAPFVYTMPEGAISLTGFHCGLISQDDAAAFSADPDYSETPPTIGLEFVLDAGGVPPLTGTSRSSLDEGSAVEMKTPLSARLNRLLITGAASSITDGSVMEDEFLPEASMSVADLVGRCHP